MRSEKQIVSSSSTSTKKMDYFHSTLQSFVHIKKSVDTLPSMEFQILMYFAMI